MKTIGSLLCGLDIITVVCIFHEYKCNSDYQDGNQFGFSDRINNLELMADKQIYHFWCDFI
jgi:hypothetical protein